MDRYLYRSRSVKQASIKQALKGVEATAKVAKGAIEGGEESSRLSSSQLALRRSTTQLDLKRKKDKGKIKTKSHKERRTDEPRRKSQDHLEDSPEETSVGEPFSEAPPLPPHLARFYEAEEKHYHRRRKMLKKGREVRSNDSTQSPDDDDDDSVVVDTGATEEHQEELQEPVASLLISATSFSFYQLYTNPI
ncbi:hypothetical protein Taro_012841 [Colocasia esculenta]|uniref:Uncharacterized protein n=1 Tax=Colocasia esculenta TaxID=4460 RepID=A0A843UDX6_COLES|nr:hypothetical protein [Colocasia esculenta]